VRLLHAGHRDAGQGADRQQGRRPHPRAGLPPSRRPPLPLHRLSEDPRRGGHAGHRRRRADRNRRHRGRSRPRRGIAGRPLRVDRAGNGRQALHRRHDRAGNAPRRGASGRARPGRRDLHRYQPGGGPARRSGRVHRGRRARRPAHRADPQGLAGVHPRGRPHVLPGRHHGLGGGRQPRDGPPGGGAGRRGLRAAAPDHRPGRGGGRRRRGRGVGTGRQHPVGVDLRPGRRRVRCACRVGPRRAGDVPDPAGGAGLPGARVDPGSAQGRRRRARPGPVLRRPGRVGRPRPDRGRARGSTAAASGRSRSPTAAPSEARRTAPTRPRPRWRPGCSTAL